MFQETSFDIAQSAHPTVPITPVILAGGFGKRLWPLSTECTPKQFAVTRHGKSLYQATLERLMGTGYRDPIVVAHLDHWDALMAHTKEKAASFLLEPMSKNTAASVLIAALTCSDETPDDVMLICPADHDIPDAVALRQVVDQAVPHALAKKIVTFGISPTEASSEYGYITPEGQFIEKPPRLVAKRLIDEGAQWNSGIFLAMASTVIDHFKSSQPELFERVHTAWAAQSSHANADIMDRDIWNSLPNISFDHAIMTYCTDLACLPLGAEWSDLGSWSHIDTILPSDQAQYIECDNTSLKTTVPDQAIVGIGLRNIKAVATSEAILIFDEAHLGDISKIDLSHLPQPRPRHSYRPWGQFECLSRGDRYQVKKITVHPNEVLSLQAHHHRAEHWIVVQGTAQVTRGDKTFLISENQSTYIPLGETHRLENPGKIPLELIEVKTGCYLGEDDIIRYEDRYNRF